jgi:hypothetical protein
MLDDNRRKAVTTVGELHHPVSLLAPLSPACDHPDKASRRDRAEPRRLLRMLQTMSSGGLLLFRRFRCDAVADSAKRRAHGLQSQSHRTPINPAKPSLAAYKPVRKLWTKQANRADIQLLRVIFN